MFRRGLTVLLLILLIANLLMLAAVLGVFGPHPLGGTLESPREPQRVDQQVRRERMEVLPPPAEASTPVPAPRSEMPAGVAPAGQVTPGSVTLAAAPANACMEMGGFTSQTVQRAKEDLAAIAAGTPLAVEQFERSEQVRWWVHLPAQPTRENADRKLAELRRRKVTDVSVVSADDPESYTVSLGLFRERERADKFLESLRGLGVRTALVSDAPRAVSRQWLRVAHADDAVRTRMDEVRLRYGAELLQSCKGMTQARGEGTAARAG
ncbi:SPOR domain-containing protein [Cupriavidus pauculus]|uniref:SPOR domain-containing protein n=1 Tax=Cupriavidus pauculus TaxID=82633 RepID=A0A2N5CIE7_9BURK|nr:SPOR domain-containing protein [Cupriavidus pauculus]PLQ02000.1 SPOR domain-containing protein [Cupriavidus pauculus]